jgi:hypothetical protein
VGYSFVKQYYTLLNTNPDHLHRFYKDDSCLTHGTEGEADDGNVTVRGQTNIAEKFRDLRLQGCIPEISMIDCQESLDQGVIVMVIGTLRSTGSRRFTQTFFLAQQPGGRENSYYVRNDILRYLSPPAPANADDVTGANNNVDAPIVNGQPDSGPIAPSPPDPPQPVPEQPLPAEVQEPPEEYVEEQPDEPEVAEIDDAPAEEEEDSEEESEESQNTGTAPAQTPPPPNNVSKGMMSWAALASVNCPEKVEPEPRRPKPVRSADETPADDGAEESGCAGEVENTGGSTHAVFVKNIDLALKEQDIRKKMQEFGPVLKVNLRIPTAGNTAYAFVDFASLDAAKAATTASADDLKIEGHDYVIQVEEKRRPVEGKTGGRGRGGRGRGDGRGNGKASTFATARTNGTGTKNSGKPGREAESGVPLGGRGGRGRADGYSTGQGRGEGRGEGKGAKEGGRGRTGKIKRPDQ